MRDVLEDQGVVAGGRTTASGPAVSIRAEGGGREGAGPPVGLPVPGRRWEMLPSGPRGDSQEPEVLLPLWAPSNIKSFFNYILQLHCIKTNIIQAGFILLYLSFSF